MANSANPKPQEYIIYRPRSLDEFKHVPDGELVFLGKMNYGLAIKLQGDSESGSIFIQRSPVDPDKKIRRLEGRFATMSFVDGNVVIFGGVYEDLKEASSKGEEYLALDKALRGKGI